MCSFNSSQIFDDREVDVDDVDSNSSRGDYARLSMLVESVKRVVPTECCAPWRGIKYQISTAANAPADNRRSHQGSQACVRGNDSCDVQRDIPGSSSRDGADHEVEAATTTRYKLGHMHKDKLLRAASNCIHSRNSRGLWPRCSSLLMWRNTHASSFSCSI
uniref:Uncharacterized protein n=1 Tax=Phytophthora fragariae TaxID=53985 RepID=A0A6A3E2B8_9STRA|nr:hypothetical protein PF009_g21852 [Phytophthora fragariae]